MAGLFTSLNTGLTSLRHGQIGMDIAGQNLSNAGVDGYTRRRVSATSAVAGPPARWSRSEIGALGVSITGTRRLADELANSRVRAEHGKNAFTTAKAASMTTLENAIGEPGDNGIAAHFTALRDAFAALSDNPDSDGARTAVLGAARDLAAAVKGQAGRFDSEVANQRVIATSDTAEVNDLAAQLATVNANLIASRGSGVDTSTLEDQRDLLAQSLAEKTGGKGTVNDNGSLDFTVGDVALVSGTKAGTLLITSGGVGDTADAPLEFSVLDVDGIEIPLDSIGGSLAASAEIINVTAPTYVADLGETVAAYADAVNALHSSAYDVDGNPTGDMFAYDPTDPARSLEVVIVDIAEIGASGDPAGGYDASVADKLADVTIGEDGYERLISGFAASAASAYRAADTQAIFTAQVDGAREAVAGVNTDEELLAMATYQRTYEAAARLITVADSMLDTLINRTGLTR